MEITIFTEGGKNLGFGHITRCISIIEGFRKQNIEPKLIIYGDDSIASVLQDKKINYTISDWFEYQDSSWFKSDIIVIDSILIKDELLLMFEKKTSLIVYIDDYMRRDVLSSGIIVDWTVLADKKDFHKIKNNVKYILGSKYTPLREDFNVDEKRPLNQDIKNILISFGGSDVKNMTPKVLKMLLSKYKEMEVTIVIGNGFDNIEKIKEIANHNTKLEYNVNSKKMSGIMQNSDIAISSGGQTLYELARIGVPTIAVILVDNQLDDITGWEEVGSLYSAGWYNDKYILDNIESLIYKIKPLNKRKDMISKTQKYISANGVDLLIKEILKEQKYDNI